MATETLEASDGGHFSTYLASPPGGSGPGIVVIQEFLGVNQIMRDICDDLATLGYFAACPDLFWRQEPGIELSDKSEQDLQRAFELLGGFNDAKGVDDLITTVAFLRRYPGCTGRVGTVGFCMGGKLAYLMATRSDADCSVSYYGVMLDTLLDEASAITKPLLMHIAGKDQFVPPEAQEKIRERMAQVSLATVHTYPDCDHAFARKDGANYNAPAAQLADQRTETFLKQHLG